MSNLENNVISERVKKRIQTLINDLERDQISQEHHRRNGLHQFCRRADEYRAQGYSIEDAHKKARKDYGF